MTYNQMAMEVAGNPAETMVQPRKEINLLLPEYITIDFDHKITQIDFVFADTIMWKVSTSTLGPVQPIIQQLRLYKLYIESILY
jgi:hypothetical protein